MFFINNYQHKDQESGTVIPCIYNGKEINYTAQMFLDDEPPIACGREIWGFPKKYGSPTLKIERDTLVGVLEYAGQQVAMGSMTYKHNSLDKEKVAESLSKTSCNLRLIPKPDGTGLERAQLVEYNLTDIEVIEASSGNARLALFPLVTAPAADIPVKKIIGGKHIRANLVLPHGRVLYDYLKDEEYITKQSSIDNEYMTKEKVLDCPSMPAIAPSYPHQDTTTIDRSIMYIHCRSDIDFLRTLIPYPVDLDSANPDIFFSISHTLGTGIGEYSSFKVLIPCEINGIRCMFNALNVTDNSSPITCGRERLGQPQKYGQPKLEVRKDTIVGTLTYGSQTISVSSMVFNAKKLSKQQTKDLMQLPELNLRVLPNVTGEVDIAQLVLMRYGNKQISEGWQGSARIHNIPHVNAPLADVPIKETVCGYHIKVSHEILAHAEILYDFKLASS